MIIADTDVLIDYLRGKEPIAERIAIELKSALKTTVSTRFELLAGARKSQELARVTDLLAVIGTIALDADSTDKAAEVRRNLERAGAPIGLADSLIAGMALRHRAMLLTRNRELFGRVAGLYLGME